MTGQAHGMGYLRGLPSLQDYHPGTDYTTDRLKALGQPSVRELLERIGVVPVAENVPSNVDLRGYFSPIEDQGNIGSCTAHATISLAEYFQIRAFKRYDNLSRLFLYKTTRNLLGFRGDTGAFMRSAMGALVLCGAPPERFYPYLERNYDREPSAFLYSVAQSFQATQYFRLDPLGTRTPEVLDRIRAFLAAGLPVMYGFTAYESIGQANSMNGGAIPYPARRERIVGGHALVVVGYDDEKRIQNRNSPDETVGALRVRNSWGVNWGDDGYGWMPYDYVLSGLADDFWTLIQMEYVESGQFGEG